MAVMIIIKEICGIASYQAYAARLSAKSTRRVRGWSASLLALRVDTFATTITIPSLRMVIIMRVTRLTNIRIFSLRPESEFFLAQLIFLLNMRVYHFLAQGRAPAAFLCTLAAQWMLGSMLLTYIGTLFADTRAEPTHLLRP